MSRLDQIKHFYEILGELEAKLGSKRCLVDCHGNMVWPQRGVYFFFEHGEERASGSGLRIVRVGTHALKKHSRTTLWHRLRSHRGPLGGKRAGGGNHRGSIFRLHVGTAILRKEDLEERYPTWGIGSSAPVEVEDHEHHIEKKVSQYIRAMPFLWVKVDDAPGHQSQRAYIEQNSIALLSNYDKLGTDSAIDPPSTGWLGFYCNSEKIRRSGLWNADHVTDGQWDPSFLEILEKKIRHH